MTERPKRKPSIFNFTVFSIKFNDSEGLTPMVG